MNILLQGLPLWRAIAVAMVVVSVWLPSTSEAFQPQEISIICEDADGCSGLLAAAVQAAGVGDTIVLGPGTYIESPFTVEKTLTITSNFEVDPPVVQFTQPESGMVIENRKIGGFMAVKISGIEFVSPVLDPVAAENLTQHQFATIQIFNPLANAPRSMSISLENIIVQGKRGIIINNSNVRLVDSTVDVEGSSLRAANSLINVENTTLRGGNDFGLGSANIVLTDGVKAELDFNRIITEFNPDAEDELPSYGLHIGGSKALMPEQITVKLNGNSITSDYGIYAAGFVDLMMDNNILQNNAMTGLLTYDFACIDILDSAADLDSVFEGDISGTGNRFLNNGTDVCPQSLTLPAGFIIGG